MAGTNWYYFHLNYSLIRVIKKKTIHQSDYHPHFKSKRPCKHIFILYYRYQNNGCGITSELLSEAKVPLYSLADVQLRFLCPNDLDEVRALCQDWFPIEYPYYWYEEITSNNRYLG